MGHPFEATNEATVTATPEQVWDAIATGPGITSWFMGHTDVTPGESVRQSFGGYTPTHPITAWEPPRHLRYGEEPDADGRFVAYEYLVEGRDRGSAVIRLVTSGFLPGDDWESEFEAMTAGGALFFATLVEYLNYFAGREAVPVTAAGPLIGDWPAAWATLRKALGLRDDVAVGDTVRLPGSDGVVYHVNAQTLGIRTPDALYRFVQGWSGPMLAMHHLFTPADDTNWASWLHTILEGHAS